jgi:hypothetical protein
MRGTDQPLVLYWWCQDSYHKDALVPINHSFCTVARTAIIKMRGTIVPIRFVLGGARTAIIKMRGTDQNIQNIQNTQLLYRRGYFKKDIRSTITLVHT